MKHSELSPSAAERWTHCVGSVIRNKGILTSDSPSSIAGTNTHAVLEHCIKSMVMPKQMVGTEMKVNGLPFTIDQEMAERLTLAMDYIVERGKKLNDIIKSEVFTDTTPLLHRADMSGTMDVHIASRNELEVMDYKDGFVDVPIKNNRQLILYAIGALSMYKGYHPKKITITIIQPRSTLLNLPAIKSHTYTDDEIGEWIDFFIGIGKKVDAGETQLAAGIHCKFCPSAGNCPALHDTALAEMGFGNEQIVKQLKQAPIAKDLTDEQLVQVITAEPLIKLMLKAANEELNNRLLLGETIDGVKLVKGNKRKAWNLTESELCEAFDDLGLHEDIHYTKKIISPAQFIKLKVGKGIMDDKVKKFVENNIYSERGKPVLALAKDTRKDYLQVDTAFKALDK